jgi:hypothetical protein
MGVGMYGPPRCLLQAMKSLDSCPLSTIDRRCRRLDRVDRLNRRVTTRDEDQIEATKGVGVVISDIGPSATTLSRWRIVTANRLWDRW